MCRLSWFLDPGGWSKTAAVGLYFIFPGICTLSLLSFASEPQLEKAQVLRVRDGDASGHRLAESLGYPEILALLMTGEGTALASDTYHLDFSVFPVFLALESGAEATLYSSKKGSCKWTSSFQPCLIRMQGRAKTDSGSISWVLILQEAPFHSE
ncbi:hypothetical protein STEG23_019089 [Scotinomys teguina]